MEAAPGDNKMVGHVSEDTITLTIGDLTIAGMLSRPQDVEPVASFRNLKYATIPGRWHEAKPLDLVSQRGLLQCTQWGPRPPQSNHPSLTFTGHLYPRLSAYDPVDEFECLNLNVYAPLSVLPAASKPGRSLPVIVWLHGGSFEWGNGGSEYDGQYLVSHSIHMGKPVLVVGLNYRLGMLGFFTSAELRQEARERGEAGYSNLGLHDQRLALQWIQRNIRFFGGDASNITLVGESAGAISVLAHLRSKMPLARNALLLSPATIGPARFAETQVTFDKACASLDLSGAQVSDHDKLAALRELPCEKLYELGADRLETILCEDPVFFDNWPSEPFQELSVFPRWIERVLVGQLSEETVAMAFPWTLVTSNVLLNAWRQIYTLPGYATEVMAAYGVDATPEDSSDASHIASPRLVKALVEYTSDAMFDKAVHDIATAHLKSPENNFPSPVTHEYLFEQIDTLASNELIHGHSYHSFSNPFLFHLPSVAGPEAAPELRTTAEAFSSAAIRLAQGDALWERVDSADSHQVAVFSSNGMQAKEKPPARWAQLVNTPERREQFLLGKSLLLDAGKLITASS